MKNRMKFGPKRSLSSLNLMQSGCPKHCEPPLLVEAHRSCGNSPVRSRHFHDIYDLQQSDGCNCPLASSSEQMICHTSSCPLQRSQSQNLYPTRNCYFNVLDAAASIRNALQSSQQGGQCASENRRLQRLRRLNPTSRLQHNPSNLENCVEDIPQGLATVLCPKFAPDIEFHIQKRAPRGLAGVIDDCSCLETGQQIAEHCHPCSRRGSLSLPGLQEFHQEVASSSPGSSRITTNIDSLDKLRMRPIYDFGTESVGSSRTSLRMETEVQHDQEQQQDLEDSYLDHNCDDFQSRWESPLRSHVRPGFKRKRSSMRSSSCREPTIGPTMSSPRFREPSVRSSNFRAQPSMRWSNYGEPSTSYAEPLSQFYPNEDALGEQLQRMSFNERRESLPGYSSWVPTPDCDQLGPERLSISMPAPGSDCRGSERLSISVVREPPDQENSELEANRRRASNAGGSSKTSMVSLNQSTPKSNNCGSGSGYAVQFSSSSDARSDNRANTEDRESENLRNIVQGAVQEAVHGERSMQKAVQKAVQQQLKQLSSSSEGQSFESFSQSCTPDESRRRAGASLDEQNSYGQILANARKSQEILEETQAAYTLMPQSKSRRSKSRMLIDGNRNGFTSSESTDENLTGSFTISLDASTSNGDKRGSIRRVSSGEPPQQAAGISYEDHMASITQLLNSINSVTQLLNSKPLQGENDRPPAARKTIAPQQPGAERSHSRMRARRLSVTRGLVPGLQTQPLPQLYGVPGMPAGMPNMGGGPGFQQTQHMEARGMPNIGGGPGPQQPQFQMGPGGNFQQTQFEMGARRGSQQPPLNNMGGGSFPYDIGVRGSQQPQVDMGGGNFPQPQFNMGPGGSFQQQQQFDMGAMSPQQPHWNMEAGIAQGSLYGQIPGNPPQGYPILTSSGQDIVQNLDARGMPLGSQFAFDPNRPNSSQSMPMPSTSSFGFAQPRTESMLQRAYGRNSSIQQSRRPSTGSVFNRRRSSNSRWRSSRSSSMMGQRGSRASISSQRRSRSRLGSSYDPNETEMKARSSLVFDKPEDAYSEEMNESGDDGSDAIPEAADETDQSESGQIGEILPSQGGDGSLQEGDGDQLSEDIQDLGDDLQEQADGPGHEENTEQQAEGEDDSQE